MEDRWAEIRSGVAETRTYVLSHHHPAEYYRCYAPAVFGRRIHLCARCSGIYPGIVAGLAAYFFGPAELGSIVLVALLPLPALVDWALTTATDRRGYNVVRTITGALLGYGYGLGLAHVLLESSVRVLVVGLCYALLAALALYETDGGSTDK